MKADSVSASEFLHMLADALYATQAPKFEKCTVEGCENKIRRGIRCEPCIKKRRQAQDRAYETRRAASRKKESDATRETKSTDETDHAVEA